jgi:hypothetical protein
MADMATRMSTLEKSLSNVRSDDQLFPRKAAGEIPNFTPAQAPTTVDSGGATKGIGDDIQVDKGSSSQYFNEVLFCPGL